ncbi:hypothetical protein GS498_06405 [Rhodococcus hoagii]|nr:hypothetical protein [Prescottella equi]
MRLDDLGGEVVDQECVADRLDTDGQRMPVLGGADADRDVVRGTASSVLGLG